VNLRIKAIRVESKSIYTAMDVNARRQTEWNAFNHDLNWGRASISIDGYVYI